MGQNKLRTLNSAQIYVVALSVAFVASTIVVGLWIRALKTNHAIQVGSRKHLDTCHESPLSHV